MNAEQARPTDRMVWDWWPLARLLITASVFGFAAHYYLGWTPDTRELATLPRRVFEVLSFCALLSFGLAHLYLILLMFPIYAIVTLNDTFYDLSVGACRVVLRPRSNRAVALAGLCGQLVLFGLCLFTLGRLAARF